MPLNFYLLAADPTIYHLYLRYTSGVSYDLGFPESASDQGSLGINARIPLEPIQFSIFRRLQRQFFYPDLIKERKFFRSRRSLFLPLSRVETINPKGGTTMKRVLYYVTGFLVLFVAFMATGCASLDSHVSLLS